MPTLMKGHTWKDYAHKMSWPAWVEIKVDEIRCEVIVDTLDDKVQFVSYAGKPLHNMEQFSKQWLALAKECGLRRFDTGFIVNGNFNDTYRWTRSSKGLPKDLVIDRTEFILFDLPELTEMRFDARAAWRVNVQAQALALGFKLLLPIGQWAQGPEDVPLIFNKARAQKYEGIMVKSIDHEYLEGTRSYGWLKFKSEADADGIITEIHEAHASKDFPEEGISEGDPLGRAGSVTIKVIGDDGEESYATPHGIGHELGRDMLANPEKYIGEWAEFNFMERDRAGGYRHPTWGRLREAKA